MGILLEVPLVNQKRNMSCWYASACMIAYFRAAGPRLGLPEKWRLNNGITVNDFTKLAKAEGFMPIRTPAANLTEQQLEVILRNNGPVWSAGLWDGVPHIVVLTGVKDGKVYINDPNPSKGKRVETIDWYNQKLYRQSTSCMMFNPRGNRL